MAGIQRGSHEGHEGKAGKGHEGIPDRTTKSNDEPGTGCVNTEQVFFVPFMLKSFLNLVEKKPGGAGLFCFGVTLDQALMRTRRRVLSTERAPFAHST